MIDDVFYFNGKALTTGHLDGVDENVQSQFKAIQSIIYDWQTGKDHFTLHTSGSTGKPKEISFTREQLTKSARQTAVAFDLPENITALICLPTNYVAGFMMVIRALVNGWKLVSVPPATDPLLHLPPLQKIEFAAFIPMQMRQMLEGDESHIEMLRRCKIIIGGGAVNEDLEIAIRHNHLIAWHTYGMTETLTHVAIRKLGPDKTEPGFQPLPGVGISTDSRGCLAVTVPVLDGEKVQTNDRVQLQADGSFVWLGRMDNVVNSGGHKVQLEKVEAAIAHSFQKLKIPIVDFFAAAIPDPKLGERVVIFLNQYFNIKTETILGFAAEKLHPYEIPKEIIISKFWKKTVTGKTDTKAIVKHYLRTNPGKN